MKCGCAQSRAPSPLDQLCCGPDPEALAQLWPARAQRVAVPEQTSVKEETW